MDYLGHVVYKYFTLPSFTYVAQIMIAFVYGIIFSPWSYGFWWMLLFLILYEIVIASVTRMRMPDWYAPGRLAIVLFSFFGWTLGRIVVEYQDPFFQRRPIVSGIEVANNKRILR